MEWGKFTIIVLIIYGIYYGVVIVLERLTPAVATNKKTIDNYIVTGDNDIQAKKADINTTPPSNESGEKKNNEGLVDTLPKNNSTINNTEDIDVKDELKTQEISSKGLNINNFLAQGTKKMHTQIIVSASEKQILDVKNVLDNWYNTENSLNVSM